jgi:Rps23 Pro-64 3,4-dihydroxylase Tpa1-like proline 4-hydroxylase
MNVEFLGKRSASPQVAIIKNFYDESELRLIMRELDFLNSSTKLLPPDQTNAAVHEDGTSKKRNTGIFLDQIYLVRNISDILQVNRKVFNPLVTIKLIDEDLSFRHVQQVNKDTTLVSYYEDSDYYEPHQDSATFTVLSYFYKEPKKFTGGDLVLTDFDYTIEIENNMVVYMPSVYLHEVTPIKMKEEDMNQGLGRYCVSMFLNYR